MIADRVGGVGVKEFSSVEFLRRGVKRNGNPKDFK
jgi:hypothetical protein